MLERLTRRPGARRPARRVGRGAGSGQGKTCGRGQKGAGARAGSKRRAWLEGGQNPIARRLPKVGFTNPFRDPPEIVNLESLGRLSSEGVIDRDAMAAAGLVRRSAGRVKILGRGEVSGAWMLRVHAISAGARRKVEAAGGSVEIVTAPAREKTES